MKAKARTKLLIKCVLVFLCLFRSAISFGQNKNELLDLYRGDTLKEVYGFNSFRMFSVEITDSLEKKEIENELVAFFPKGDNDIQKMIQAPLFGYFDEQIDSSQLEVMQIDTNVLLSNNEIHWDDAWNLCLLKEIDWFQQGGIVPSFRRNVKYFDVKQAIQSFQTSDLFSFCRINDSLFQKEFPLSFLPSVKFDRDCPYNNEWTISYLGCPNEKCKTLGSYTASIPSALFCTDYHSEFLVLRYVSSYPDGSMTSWFREKLYFFKKEKPKK